LADYPDGSFDCVILAQTLQYLDDPTWVLGEMLRVGRRAIVSFPNWGYWRCRLELLARGRIPAAPDLPQPWYDTPRRQALSAADFAAFCHGLGMAVGDVIYLCDARVVAAWPNLRAKTAVFALQRD
jgi:methionine biosynthesis protein MetW